MEKVYREYEKFIEKCVWDYLKKTGVSNELYDDVHSEAVIAFLDTCHKFGVKNVPLAPPVIAYAKNAMRTAMRKYIWAYYNMKSDIGRKIDHRRSAEMPEEIYFDADFSAPEAEDILKLLAPTEKVVIGMKLAGYRNADIALERGVTSATVSNAFQRMRRKIQKGLYI